MAAGHIKNWLKSLSLAGGGGSHPSNKTGTTETSPRSHLTSAATLVTSNLGGDEAGPVLAQIEDTTETTTSSAPACCLSPERAKEYMKNIKRFRILIMGRANAGKTTILQRVCNSTAEPEVYDGKGNKIDGVAVQGTLTRGYHNIEHEILFQSNPGFVFHDSCGFEAGSTHQYDEMKKFVVDRATTRKVNERIHAIWFCIPMAECHRTVTAAEEKFFNECDTGHVPLIVVLTKADTLNLDAVQELEDEGLEIEEDKVVEKERKLLEKWCAHIKDMLHKCNFPPRAYVSLQKMHEQDADCTTLMQSTANSLNEEGLQKLLISTQQSSVALCVEYAVQKTLKKCMQQYPQGRFVLDVKFFEHVLMSWFPNCEKYWGRYGGYRYGFKGGSRLGDWEDGFRGWRQFFELDDNAKELPQFEVDPYIDMPPLSKDVTLLNEFPTVQAVAEHAIACLLVTEHAYFLMQHGHHTWEEALLLSVEQFKSSNNQTTISQSIKADFHDHNGNVDGLCDATLKIIMENCMSKKLLMGKGGK